MTIDHDGSVLLHHIAAGQYDAAGEPLLDLAQEFAASSALVSKLNRLLDQCSRLADDQQRLDQVLRGLARDEEELRAQLLQLVERVTTCASGVAAKPSPESEPESEPEHGDQPPPEPQRMAIYLLGPCWLSYGGAKIDIGNGDRCAAIVRFLAAHSSSGIHKEQLAAHFWPAASEQSARRNLHQAIYTIRRQLARIGADAELQFVHDRYVMGGPDRWRDIDELEQLMAEARQARGAGDRAALMDACRRIDDLYTGHFLDGHPYDDWAEGPRQHLRNLHREAASVLLEHHRQLNEFSRVVALAERLLKLDRTDEDACRPLMRAQTALGQPHLGVNAFVAQAKVLVEEFAVVPSSESVALANQLAPGRTFDEYLLSVE